MKRLDLEGPILRRREKAYSEFQYSITERIFLPQAIALPKTTFSKVLALRRSRREFNPVTQRDLNTLLWHSARALEVSPPARSARWQHRPAPSAGGRHPIDIFIIGPGRDKKAVYLYQPEPHALAKLRIANDSSLESLVSSIGEIIAVQNATIFWFGAQFDRMLSRYKNGESLVWRDSGALMATIALVAECLTLNCCAAGITGEPFISSLLESESKVVGVGGLLIGSHTKGND